MLVDDYAHHPREIAATLSTARECWPRESLLVFFQPHRYSRTRALMDEFLGAFHEASEVVILPIYAAGEPALPDVSNEVLVEGMRRRGHRSVRVCSGMKEARRLAVAALEAGRTVLMLGAGSIGGLAEDLRRSMQEKAA